MTSRPTRCDPRLAALEHRLTLRTPRLAEPVSNPRNQAAVALVLHGATPEHPLELLFIERAKREGDHWSGDMAFPGGRRDATDRDEIENARRETLEELGFVLPPPLGRLDDFDSRLARRDFEIVVSPIVFAVAERPSFTLSEEVASAHWIPLDSLFAPENRDVHYWKLGGARVRTPSLRIGDRIIWGMTYRMLAGFAKQLDCELPLT